MLFEVHAPPAAARAELCALRLSLNAPVVAVDELPVGPARAAIALHRQGERVWLTLAVRSLRTGQMVFFRCDDELMQLHGSDLAVDAALSFAESMGFLFDDDPIEAGGDPVEAARAWTELLEGRVQAATPPSSPARSAAPPPESAAPLTASEEILLDEVAGPDAVSAPALTVRLTKFRPRDGHPPDGPEPARTVAPGPWIRLLGAF